MRRGGIYTAAARGAYAGKPRPVLIIQDDRLDATASARSYLFMTGDVEAPLLLNADRADASHRRSTVSSLMIEKVTTVPRASLTHHIGRLSKSDLVKADRALLIFLGPLGNTRLVQDHETPKPSNGGSFVQSFLSSARTSDRCHRSGCSLTRRIKTMRDVADSAPRTIRGGYHPGGQPRLRPLKSSTNPRSP